MYEKFFIFSFVILIFAGCQSGKVVSNIGERNRDYRNEQSEYRNIESEIAGTGARINEQSNDITERAGRIREQGAEIERAIESITNTVRSAETNEFEIRKIIQRIRTRAVNEDTANAIINRYEFSESE